MKAYDSFFLLALNQAPIMTTPLPANRSRNFRNEVSSPVAGEVVTGVGFAGVGLLGV